MQQATQWLEGARAYVKEIQYHAQSSIDEERADLNHSLHHNHQDMRYCIVAAGSKGS